jgi:hypothetical protein
VVWTEIPGIQISGHFRTNLEHILDELARIELRLFYQIKTRRRDNASNNEGVLRGCFISDQEMDDFEHHLTFLSDRLSAGEVDPSNTAIAELEQQIQEKIASRKQDVLETGQELRLDRLSTLFHLSPQERDILLICLLPEIDLKYQRLYGYLQDDITKKMPTVDTALRLINDSWEHTLYSRDILSSLSPLVKNQLVYLIDDLNSRLTPLPAKFIRLDERIAGYLLGSDQVDGRLNGLACPIEKKTDVQDDSLPDEIRERLPGLASKFRDTGLVLHLRDFRNTGQKTAAVMLGTALKTPIMYVDLEMTLAGEMSPDKLLSLIFREGLLQRAALYFSSFDSLLGDEKTYPAIYHALL